MEPERRPLWSAGDPPPLDPLLQERFVLPLLQQLRRWREQAGPGGRRLPLIALNGPVGSGKSSLGCWLEALAPRFGLRLVVASIDDLYLTWPERGRKLAGNPFGVSRVPPGSHDLPLLLAALERWRSGGVLRLPRFDKTLAGGQGDRAGWREQACDALVLEGWLLGCRPLDAARLNRVLSAARMGDDSSVNGPDAPLWSGCGAPPLRPLEWQWLPGWNTELQAYLPLWQACDGLWLLRPEHWGLPRRWRFQAEARQRRSGGGWLPASDLEALVRASLCSLPPALYQDPLLAGLPAERSPDGDGVLTGALTDALAEAAPDGSTADLLSTPASGSPERAGDPLPRRRADARHSDITGLPVQAVAWLDGRRRCRRAWLQPSLSLSSSETGYTNP